MSYTLKAFGNLDLPAYAPSGDLGPAQAVDGLVPLPFGAVFDVFGSGIAPGKYPYTITWQCRLVADSVSELRRQVDTLLNQLWHRQKLWRRALDDNSLSYAYARLSGIKLPHVSSTYLVQDMTLTLTVQTGWVAA